MISYDRHLLALTFTELEKFVRDWAKKKENAYFRVEPFSGSGDKGRDVVGFASSQLHEGDWDNYQCKQYGKTLPTASAFHEIGKIFYYASKKEFTLPRAYKFVAPRGVNRNLEKLLFNPAEFRTEFLASWAKYCERTIIDGAVVPLTHDLISEIQRYDFSRISRVDLDGILADPAAKPVLYKWFGADPGPAPHGSAPDKVHTDEMPYLTQLVDAYSERAGRKIVGHKDASADPAFGPHLSRQRERFYDAAIFKRFYRDNTDTAVIEAFESDIYHGVADICDGDHKDALARVEAVMTQASNVQPSGVLAPHSRVKAKQGICHHFANETLPRLRWRRP